jgi:hypothetical protein
MRSSNRVPVDVLGFSSVLHRLALGIPIAHLSHKSPFQSGVAFHTLPGRTHEVEEKLLTLLAWVQDAGGLRPRVMRTHFGSLGAPDLIFEQEVKDPGALEAQIKKVTENKRISAVGQAGIGDF